MGLENTHTKRNVCIETLRTYTCINTFTKIYTHTHGAWENRKCTKNLQKIQIKGTKHSISSTEGWKLVFPLKQIKWKYYSTFQKCTEGQTPTLCFYIRSAFCKLLEAFLKNHPSTHIHLLPHRSAFPLQRISWCFASPQAKCNSWLLRTRTSGTSEVAPA